MPAARLEIVSVLLPVPPELRLTVAGFAVAVGPEVGFTDVASVTDPVKRLRLTSESVDVVDCPALTIVLATLEDIVKSTT